MPIYPRLFAIVVRRASLLRPTVTPTLLLAVTLNMPPVMGSSEHCLR